MSDLKDAPLNVRNATTFFRTVKLFPNFFIEALGEEAGVGLYNTAIIWDTLDTDARRTALKEAKEINTNAIGTSEESSSSDS